MTERQNSTPPGSHWPSLFDLSARAAGVGSVLAFTLSVVYDYGYFDAIGLSFWSVPTAIGDHVRTGLLWLPPTLGAFAGGMALNIVLRRIEGGRTEEEILASSPRVVAIFRRSADSLPFVLAVVVPLSFVLFGGPPGTAYLAAALFWWLIALWVTRHERMRLHFSVVGAIAFVVVPGLLLFVVSMGANKARSDFYRDGPTALFAVDGADGRSIVKARPLRYFEHHVLAVDETQKLRILRGDSLISVGGLSRPYVYEGLLCSWLGVACGENLAVPTQQRR